MKEGFRLLWHRRTLWRRDLPIQRTVSLLIVILGLAIGGVGATLNSLEGSAAHLAFFLLATLVIYAVFLSSREIFDVYPHHRVRDEIRAITKR